MKLLFDQNLSRVLVRRLADLFPGSSQLVLLGMQEMEDPTIWAYARDHGYILVTKDLDFIALAVVRGHPPKVIRVAIGNCSTGQVESLLRWRHGDIVAFNADPLRAVLELE